MIFFGTKHIRANSPGLQLQEPLDHGGSLQLDLNVYQQVAHVYWIPAFPLGKRFVGFKDDAGLHSLNTEALPPTMRPQVDALLQESRTPLWAFTWLLVVAGVLVVGQLSSLFGA